jgi:hypothetical protein
MESYTSTTMQAELEDNLKGQLLTLELVISFILPKPHIENNNGSIPEGSTATKPQKLK